MMQETSAELTEPAPWWALDGVLLRFVQDLISGELRRLRPGGGYKALESRLDPALDIIRDLGVDSLERLTIASTLAEALHLSETGIQDYLLARTTLNDWVAIAQTSLRSFSQRLTFRTSGSTGQPKACTHVLESLEQEIDELASHLSVYSRIISAVSCHHIYGFLFTVLLPRRLGIAEMSVLDVRGSSPASVLPLLRRGDLVIGHPEFWRNISRGGMRFSAGVDGITSTAPLPDGVGEELTAMGLSRLVQIYGSTETAGVGWRDDGKRGYRLFSYWRRREADRESIQRRLPNGEWLRGTLQDRLNWLGNDVFLPSGRIDDAVQVGGINVFPARVRDVLMQHPQVADATVRLMHAEEGNRLKAFIVTKEDDADLVALRADLDDWTATRLSNPEIPRAFCFGGTLPRDVQGKLTDWVVDSTEKMTSTTRTMSDDFHTEATATPSEHHPDATLARLLTWGDRHRSYVPDSGERAQLEVGHRRLEAYMTRPGTRIYGIHTGYGANVGSGREAADWQQNQLDLLAYLSVGVGSALPERVVRRALRLQAWKAARGLSGLHPQTHADLLALADGAQLPTVPCYGSLGASGDLVPMAHAVAPLFATTAPRGPRDVLSLVNTNAMMSSLALECFERTHRLHTLAVTVTAAASIALGVIDEPFDPAVLGLNPLQPAVADAGRSICAARRRLLLATGPIRRVHEAPLQERYSVRCAPQVLGNAQENLRFSGERILAEALSVADNPLILDEGIWHGGLFYAAGLATAADLMHDAIARYAEMVDRQVLLLVDPTTSHGLPENLQAPGALHVKGIHQLLSSLNQALRARGVPSRQLSFSCEGNNQDIVPCGMVALVGLSDSLDVAEQALRAAAFCADRALCLRADRPLPEELHLHGWPNYDPMKLGTHATLTATPPA